MNIDLKKIFSNKDYQEEKAIQSRPKNIPNHKKHDGNLPKGKALERRVWRLFYNMGAKITSGSRQDLNLDLSTDYGQGKASQKSKQIDGLFIMRDNYSFVVECKDSETIKPKNSTSLMTENFDKWKALKKPINTRIKKIFAGNNLREPLHVIVTSGYEWSEHDKEQLNNEGFILIGDAGLNYFESCFNESKSNWFTFNQFLSFYRKGQNDFGRGRKKEEKSYVGFRTRSAPGKDGILNTKDDIFAYTTSMKVIDLLKVSTVAHKKADDIEVLGETTKNYYQRILKSSRLSGKNGLPKFIREKEGPFINNLLINYRGEKSLNSLWEPFEKGQGRGGLLTFNILSPGMFHIIDGQHRLFGYSPLIEQDGEDSDFANHELIVTIFDGLDPQDEARNFLQINKNQKAIDASLVLEVQLVFGAYGEDKEVLENLATTLVHSLQENSKQAQVNSPFAVPSAIKPSESMKNIDHTGESVEQGALTIKGMVTALVRSPLLQTEGSFESGYAFKDGVDRTDQFNNTYKHILEIYNTFFWELRKAKPGLWETNDSKNRIISNKQRIAQNIPMSGFLMLFDLFIQRKAQPKKKILNSNVMKLVSKLTTQLQSMTIDEEELLFDNQTYGGSGPKQFYHQLLERFHPDLIDDIIKVEIENSKKEFNAFSEREKQKIIDKYEETIRKINSAKDIREKLWEYESFIRDNINNVLTKIFGKGYYYAEGERSFFREEFSGLLKIADNARDKRKASIAKIGGKIEDDGGTYPDDIMYLQWDHWQELITKIIHNSKNFQAKYAQDIFSGEHQDLQSLLKHLFFASKNKPAKKLNPEEGLEWMQNFNSMRNSGAHPSKKYELMTEREEKYFTEMGDKIDKKIVYIKDFLVK